MKSKKQTKQETEIQEATKSFLFILGWTALTFVIAFILSKSVEYSRMVESSMLGFTILVGWILWKVIIKKEKK